MWAKVLMGSLVTVLLVTGCAGTKSQPDDWDDLDQPEEMSNGVIYTDLSQNFDLTIFPATVETRDGSPAISYSYRIENKSPRTFQDFFPSLLLNPELDQYLAAGIQPIPMTKTDLVPKSVAEESVNLSSAFEVKYGSVISPQDLFAESDLAAKDILTLAADFEIWMQWDGGEETLSFSTEVEDPNDILTNW